MKKLLNIIVLSALIFPARAQRSLKGQYYWPVYDCTHFPEKDVVSCLYGFVDRDNKWETEPQYIDIDLLDERGQLFEVFNGKKYGVIDCQGKTLFPFKYERVNSIFNGSFIVLKGDSNTLELFDSKKNQIIPPIYDLISQGTAIYNNNTQKKEYYFYVRKNKKIGLVDSKNKLIIPTDYDLIHYRDNGYFLLYKDNLRGVADTNGIILPARYYVAEKVKLSSGIVIISNGPIQKTTNNKVPSSINQTKSKGEELPIPLYGAINLKGDTLIDIIYEKLSYDSLSPTILYASLRGKLFVFNSKGEKIIELNENEYISQKAFSSQKNYLEEKDNYPINHFFGPHIRVISRSGKTGLIDLNNSKILIPIEQDSITPIELWGITRIVASKKDKFWTLHDSTYNKILIDSIEDFKTIYANNSDHNSPKAYIKIKRNGQYGIIDQTGTLLIPTKYQYIQIQTPEDIEEFIMLVDQKQVYFFHLKDLKTKITLKDIWGNSDNTLALFNPSDEPNQYGLIDENGRIVIPFEYENWLTSYENNNELNLYALRSIKQGKKLISIYNEKGEIILQEQNENSFGQIKDDMMPIISKAKKVGLYDFKLNKLVVDTLFDLLYFDHRNTSNNYWVKNHTSIKKTEDNIWENWGLWNERKNYAIKPNYQFPVSFEKHFSPSYGMVFNNDLTGLIRDDGHTIFPCIYEEIKPQLFDLYFIKQKTEKGSKWGVGNIFGKILIRPQFDDITPLYGDNALFWKGQKIGILHYLSTDSVKIETIDFTKTWENLGDPNGMFRGWKFFKENNKEIAAYSNRENPIKWESQHYDEFEMIENLISYWGESEQLLKNIKSKSLPRIISNMLYVEAFKNYAYEQNKLSNLKLRNTKYSIYGSLVNEYQDIENKIPDGYKEVKDITTKKITLLFVSDSILSYLSEEMHDEGQEFSTKLNFKNHIIKNDTFYPVRLFDLINDTKENRLKMNTLLIKALSEAEADDKPDCQNLDNLFEQVLESFSMNGEELVFYFKLEDWDDLETRIELPINYKDLRAMINLNGPLKPYFNK